MRVQMKKEMSAGDLRVVVGELQKLVGARIEKAYHPEKNVIVLKCRGNEGKISLVFDTRGFFFASQADMDMPMSPSSFAMLLRKHLAGGRIEDVWQYDFDRLLSIDVSARNTTSSLVLELFGGGNAILVQDNNILMPLRHKTWSHRTVRPNQEYLPPPPRPNPLEMDEDYLFEILSKSKKDVVRCLATDVNLGGELAEEVCISSSISMAEKASELGQDGSSRIFSAMEAALSCTESPEPYMALEDKRPIGFSFMPLPRYKEAELLRFSTMSEAVEQFYNNADLEIHVEEPVEDNRLLRQLEHQKSALSFFHEEEKNARKAAEAIYANYSTLQPLLSGISEARKRDYDWVDIKEEIVSREGVLDLDPAESVLHVSISSEDENVNVQMDINISIEENASRYYDRAKKAKEKAEGAENAIEDTKKAIASHESRNRKKEKEKEARKTFWFERYKWFITSEENLVIAGRDVQSNDRVVKRHMKENDRYVHADVHGAPSVLVKDIGNGIGEKSLEEACNFAFLHSKAWNAGIGHGEAYWVLPDQVSKTPNPGEFLPKGAFVIRGKRNYVKGIQLQAVLHFQEWQGVRVLMCSPSPKEGVNPPYAIIEPGDMKKNIVSKTLSPIFGVAMDEIMRLLPPGNARIMEIKKAKAEE